MQALNSFFMKRLLLLAAVALMPLLLVSISFLAGRRVGRRECCADDVRRDTIVVRDTVRDTVPVDRWRTFVRVDTCYLVRVDSLMLRDTVRVEMPIEQVEYRTDRYRAVVEGWRPKLLSIECYDSRQIITDTRRVATRKRWGIVLGAQVGYGITPEGPQPYAGVGLSFGLRF